MTTDSTRLYTGPTAEDLRRIPPVLTRRPQWVLWKGAETVNEATGEIKLTKVPINPRTLHKASTTDPATWGTFDYCVLALPVALEEWEHATPDQYRGGGLGFVFTDEDPYTGIDLDKCRNPDTGTIDIWAQVHVAALASYAEITPSGTGLHILVEGTLPAHGRKKGTVEMYTTARFFTMTGWHVPSTPTTIEPRQAAVDTFHTQIFGAAVPPQNHASVGSLTLDDTALLARARAAKNGPKFVQLWSGDTSLHGGDDSVADLALCCALAFWTQDSAQIDRLFRQSDLMREKWDRRRGKQTYGERTIQEALAKQTEHYHPPPPDDDDQAAQAGALAHRLPDHLRDHPDPYVRQYWRRLYRTANALKQARAKEGLLL